MGARLMAIVAEGERGRVYLAPTPEHEATARKAKPEWKPESDDATTTRAASGAQLYGLTELRRPLHRPPARGADDLLRPGAGSARAGAARRARRRPARRRRSLDATAAAGATAYADAVAVVSGVRRRQSGRLLAARSALGSTAPQDRRSSTRFGRQAIPMVWDFAEANPFRRSSGDLLADRTRVIAESLRLCCDRLGDGLRRASRMHADADLVSGQRRLALIPPTTTTSATPTCRTSSTSGCAAR